MNIFFTYVEDEWIHRIIKWWNKSELVLKNSFPTNNSLSFDEIALDFVHIEEIRFDYMSIPPYLFVYPLAWFLVYFSEW